MIGERSINRKHTIQKIIALLAAENLTVATAQSILMDSYCEVACQSRVIEDEEPLPPEAGGPITIADECGREHTYH